MNIKIPIFLLILLVAWSCQKEPTIRFGFDADFGKDSHGITIMNVANSTKTITLKGEIDVTEGAVIVQLIAASGDTVYTSQFTSSDSHMVNESFDAVSGNWKLEYNSLEAIGSLTLHLIPLK